MTEEGIVITVYGLKEEKRIGSIFSCESYLVDKNNQLVLIDEKDKVWAVLKDWTYFTLCNNGRRPDINEHK